MEIARMSFLPPAIFLLPFSEDLPSGEDLSFLQSATMLSSTAPSGLAGCLVSGSLVGEALSSSSVDLTQNILSGFCPDA